VERYETDEQQLEAVKKWWQENGKAIIAGIVLGLGGLFGWQSWQTHQARQAEAASAAYQKVMAFSELKDLDNAREAARTVIEQHPRSVYATLASFALAKFAVQEGNYEEARARLSWIMEQSTDRKMQQIARLRLVRLHLNDQDYTSAWNTLNGGDDDLSQMSTYHELKGDI
jgi:predicted negative regulator of RcsB-dependent stress response